MVVIGQADDGELRTTEPECQSDREDLLRDVQRLAPLTFPIGIHFDLPGLAGSSFTVVGSSCIGGWLNLNAAWINRVSSTSNGCPNIAHFDGYNLTGASTTTTAPGGNLGVMANRTNSIQYLP